MLCPSCKNFRPANNAPCPFCQAPSPLGQNQATGQGSGWSGQQPFGGSGVWGGLGASEADWNAASGQLAFPTSPWQNASNSAQQLAFSTTAQQSGNAFWPQTFDAEQAGPEAGSSLLPMPYQGPLPAQGLMIIPNGFSTLNERMNTLVPALPEADQEAPLYVPPMYTKPRPLISRYRAVSGMLSVLIVFGLLCTAAGYYAQTTGKLVFFQKLFGTYAPPAITTQTGALTVPSLQQTVVPNSVITSAAITNRANIDLNTGIIANEVNQFNVNDIIYLTCNFAPTKGTVMVKWYNGKNLYHTAQKVTDGKAAGVLFEIVYALSAEGKAEIYWNNQLQITLFFVVEPAP